MEVSGATSKRTYTLLRVGIHVIFCAQFAFGTYYYHTHVQIPKSVGKSHQSYGGKFKFLTFLNAVCISISNNTNTNPLTSTISNFGIPIMLASSDFYRVNMYSHTPTTDISSLLCHFYCIKCSRKWSLDLSWKMCGNKEIRWKSDVRQSRIKP